MRTMGFEDGRKAETSKLVKWIELSSPSLWSQARRPAKEDGAKTILHAKYKLMAEEALQTISEGSDTSADYTAGSERIRSRGCEASCHV